MRRLLAKAQHHCGFQQTLLKSLFLLLAMPALLVAQDGRTSKQLDKAYQPTIRPLLARYCQECHEGDDAEAEVDLASFTDVARVRTDIRTWLRVREMLSSRQMPPKDARQPSDDERAELDTWVQEFLTNEARAHAGDPGPIVLRRLNNEEYNYAVRDLTGVRMLNPTREFPVDGAAGEGFINSGAAQGMSPSLVSKYLDAAKDVADHAMLIPSGIRFTDGRSQRDRTDELMDRIRSFYQPFLANSGAGGGQPAWQNFQQESRFPFERYLDATIRERVALQDKTRTLDDVARQYQLNRRYLGLLYQALTSESEKPSIVLDKIRVRWRAAEADDLAALATDITGWQSILWQFNPIGHIGRAGGPRAWMSPATPLAGQRDFELKLPVVLAGQSINVNLVTGDAGDGDQNDLAIWKNARLVGEGPDIPLHVVKGLVARIADVRKEMLGKSGDFLAAAAEAMAADPAGEGPDLKALATKHKIDPAALSVWLEYIGIGVSAPVRVTGHFTQKTHKGGDYDFIKGWGSPETPLVSANLSDQEVRVPGIARPRSVMVHPSPTLFVAVGWQSPVSGNVRIEAFAEDVHPECGNGQEWFVQYRTSRGVNNLGRGDFVTRGKVTFPAVNLDVHKGDLVSLLVGPRAGQHACDLTQVNLVVTETSGEKRSWDLAAEISKDIHAGNPHPDSHGFEGTWHFYKGLMTSIVTKQGPVISIPVGSILARWRAETDAAKKSQLADQVQALAIGPAPDDPQSADGQLYRQLHSLEVAVGDIAALSGVASDNRFGSHPRGDEVNPADLVVQAPAVTTIQIPAQLANQRTLVVSGGLEPKQGREGSVQLEVTLGDGVAIPANSPFVVVEGSDAEERIDASLNEFRDLFPGSLCYSRIVPVDQTVTLTLYFREDQHLQRLMLDELQTEELNRLWDELLYVSHEPLKYEIAFEQIREFATQDRPDLVKEWAPLIEGVTARAEKFRQRLIDDEPVQLQAVIDIASQVWRRPLTTDETQRLRELFTLLRENGLAHPEATRLLLARVLTSPAFLYRLESPPAGEAAASVSDFELASRLSFFLWSSLPDAELREVAAAGQLMVDEKLDDARSELLNQTRRMLLDPRCRRLAIQFACQWLHLRDFDQNDDKNEQLYPEFAELRSAMYEETIQFFTDMFQHDGSILSLIDADHTFLNPALASHYGIPLKQDPAAGQANEWQRVEGLRGHGRGGILGMATFLASQSGASRTSPILRGNWVYETLLGERLPRPPANVPQLPEVVPSGLTARQLIEKHSSVAECATCHAKIDPYGFALSQFDAIGRKRSQPVDTSTRLADGTELQGIAGLQDYLLNERRGDVVRQFCKKLLGFALGREVQLSDEPLLDEIQLQLAENDYRFSVAVAIIVTSPQFRQIRGLATAE